MNDVDEAAVPEVPEEPVECRRCHRGLRTKPSRDEGIGRVCKRREAAEASVTILP